MATLDLEGDLALFLSLDEFAVEATLDPDGEEPRTASVIFDRRNQDVFLAERQLLQQNALVILGRTADLNLCAQGDSIRIDSTAYKVISNEPDGTGVSTLHVETVD